MFEMSNLWEQISGGGARPFMIHKSGTVSYGELRALVAKAHASIASNNLRHGDRVVILLEEEAFASAAFAACLLSGLVPIMLPFDIGLPRLDGICRTVEPGLVIRDTTIFAVSEPASIQPCKVTRDDLAYLLFTSGTTAEPSGVEITHGNLSSHIETLARLFGFGSETRILNPTPIAHTDGLIFGSVLTMFTGGTVIRPGPMRVPEFETWIGMARKYSANYMMTNPTVLNLIERIAQRDDYFVFDGFKGVLSGGSQLRREAWLHFEERFHTEIWNLYGLTETVTTALYSGRHPEMGPVGSLGMPIDCEARVAPALEGDFTGADKNVGELQLRGPHIFRGYWRNPERTTRTFATDNWMRTGDLVQRNEDGSFSFLGRIKTAINSGGTLIRGEEIDECLLRHPSVAEAVTVGLKDDEFEEIAVSAVVLKGSSSESELMQHCRSELEALKVPKRILIIESIPRGDAGKPRLVAVKTILSEVMRSPQETSNPKLKDIGQRVIAMAAMIFGVEEASLSRASSPNSVEGWDSFRHVNLILQCEQLFDIRIPGTLIGKIANLGDLIQMIDKLTTARQVSHS